tara:strand:- start:2275 stop:4227 length:1953 start_codon:yes stop_codon:yes gene_type:complete
MNIQDISKDLLASVSSIIEKKSVKEVDEPRSKGEKDFKDLHTKNVKVHTEKKKNECASEKDFKPHMMYDPKTGKGFMAKTYDDHLRMDKMGYTHDKPEVKEAAKSDYSKDDFEPHMMYDPKTGEGFMAKTLDDHERMKKMGYVHDKPEVKEAAKSDYSKDDFKPHMMYDPKTGKGFMAKTLDDHERMNKMGYVHDKPEVKEVAAKDHDKDNFKPHMMYDPKTGKGFMAKTFDDHVRMDKMGYTHEKPEVKEVDEPTAKGEKDFKDLHLKDLNVFTEKLDPRADAGEWIEDFIKSDAPQFKGKSKEERKKMALAAYFSAREKAGLDEGADKDVKGDKEAYRKFFQGMLKKFGVKSPAEIPADKEKEFYNAIDAGWKADNEKKESIKEMKEPFIVIDTADNNKVVGTASNEKGAERIIASSERPPISIKDKKTLKIVKSNKKQNVGFPMKEETLEELKSATGYEIYHKDFSSAMQHAYDFAKKKLKVEVDPEEIDREVAMGPKRPSKGKENSYRLKGKGGAIQVQVYNTGKSFELNMYKESVKEETLEERVKSMDPKKRLKIFNELKKGDKIGIAYDTPMAKADIYKDGKLVYREFTVTRNKTVVGKARVEKITLAKDNVKSGVKFFLYNRNGQVTMAIGDLAAVIIDMKKM